MNGCIYQNNSKLYPSVPTSTQVYSRWDNTIIWNHPAEIHVDTDGNPNDLYRAWREKGMNAEYAVRYPVGSGTWRKKCICILTDDGRRLGLADGRKEVYLKTFAELAKKTARFDELRKRYYAGENLLIIEVDGPHGESLEYYQEKYGVNEDFIVDDTILVNIKNMDIMVSDAAHSFGHGYCLAIALMGIEKFYYK